MKRKISALVGALAIMAGLAVAEPYYVSLSATTTATTYYFGRTGASVMACNDGAGVAYFRLFDSTETPAAATTSSVQLPIGACLTFTKPPTGPAFWAAINVLSASTSTVRVYVN